MPLSIKYHAVHVSIYASLAYVILHLIFIESHAHVCEKTHKYSKTVETAVLGSGVAFYSNAFLIAVRILNDFSDSRREAAVVSVVYRQALSPLSFYFFKSLAITLAKLGLPS